MAQVNSIVVKVQLNRVRLVSAAELIFLVF